MKIDNKDLYNNSNIFEIKKWPRLNLINYFY